MALPSTVRRFCVELSDVDRGIYDTLDLRVAQHPSEAPPFLVTRVLAYVLNVEEGIGFAAGGLSSDDEPAVRGRDLTGALTLWVEIGHPSPERLGKATRACDRVQVWTYKEPGPWERTVHKARVHRAGEIALYVVPQAFLQPLEDDLGRTNRWTVVRNDGTVHVTAGDSTVAWSASPRLLEGPPG